MRPRDPAVLEKTVTWRPPSVAADRSSSPKWKCLMTARLARLADIAYRRRRLTVAAWIALLIVIFPVSNALKGKFHADYATPGSDSRTASTLIEHRFGGFSGSTVDVVWHAESGANSPTTRARVGGFLARASMLNGVGRAGPTRVSPDGKIAATSLE